MSIHIMSTSLALGQCTKKNPRRYSRWVGQQKSGEDICREFYLGRCSVVTTEDHDINSSSWVSRRKPAGTWEGCALYTHAQLSLIAR